jgi:hypothetical protein
MVHTVLLGVHITAGTIGLLLGPLALAVPKRVGWHPRLGVAYQCAVAVMTATALGLVALAPGRLWWLGLIAVATEAAALAGWAVRRRHPAGWLGWHIRLMCGSYLSFVTAALVVNWASPLAWVLPTTVGTPLIIRTVQRVAHPSIRSSTPAPRPVRSEMSA